MKLIDMLDEMGMVAGHIFEAITINPQLKEMVENGGTPGWNYFFIKCEERFDPTDIYNYWHATQVCKVAEKLCGDDTWESLEATLQRLDVASPDLIADIERYADRSIVLDDSLFIVKTQPEIFEFFSVTPGLNTIDVGYMDTAYRVPTKEQCMHILEKSPTHILKYIPEERDCDDFMRMMRGWLAENAYGNLSIGSTLFRAYKVDGSLYYVHAVNIMIYHENGELKVLIAEPQSAGTTWQLSEVAPRDVLKCDHYEYYYVSM